MLRLITFLFVLLMSLLPLRAAEVNLQVTHGWDGKQRSGRWNPVFVRASASVPKNVTLEWISPDQGFATVIEQHVAIGPTLATFELLAAAHYAQWEQSVVVCRDEQSGKLLGQFPPRLGRSAPRGFDLGPRGIVVGVSGRRATLRSPPKWGGSGSVWMPQRLLPRSPMGYDSLEVLFLNQIDLAGLDLQQQQAILSWVESGGGLLIVPTDTPPPSQGPLAAALPCQIGPVDLIELSSESLKAAGLEERFSKMAGHSLQGSADAHRLVLLEGSQVIAWSRRKGLGQIVVCPIDAAALRFKSSQAENKFWEPVFAELLKSPPAPSQQLAAVPYQGFESESEDQRREGAAISALHDFAGDLSGPKPLLPAGFAVLFAILLVVGPLDWLVLRLSGARPWMWSTLGGSIALAGLCGLCLADAMRRAPVQFCSIRLIDQADDRTIATSSFVALGSAPHVDISVAPVPGESEPASWWQTVMPGIAPGSVSPQRDIQFHQNDVSNLPLPVPMMAGQMRYLRGDAERSGPPVLTASLTIDAAGDRLTGSITNKSTHALKDLHLRTSAGLLKVPLPASQLAPGQTVQIDLPAHGEPFDPDQLAARYQRYARAGPALGEADLWRAATDLSGRRSLRIDALLADSNRIACIYAKIIDPGSVATDTSRAGAVGRSYQFLRAVVSLKR